VNYLAHLFLAGNTAESLIGNLAGDFVKGPLGDHFTPAIAEGIRNHRRVDAFTDSHPAVAAFRRVLVPEHGHYARVIADVFFDHFLVRNWNQYSEESLTDFLARVFATIDPHLDLLPGRLAAVYSANDLVGAFARDSLGTWELEVVPGGELQREKAIRLGVNLAMYAMCLDYKEDQVHIPFIMKRRRI